MADVGPRSAAFNSVRNIFCRRYDYRSASPAAAAKIAAALFGCAVVGYTVAPEVRLTMALRGPGEQPDHPSIVMLGDSHTDFVNWQILANCKTISNAGKGGDTTAKMLSRLPQILDQNPKAILMMAGTNDAIQHVPTSVTLVNIDSVKTQVIARGAAFFLIAPPPLPAAPDGIAPIVMAASITVPFTTDDLLPDKTHLRRSGYAKWRDAIAPIIRKYC